MLHLSSSKAAFCFLEFANTRSYKTNILPVTQREISSCGNKAANNNAEATDSVAVVEEAAVVEEVVADSAACDSTAACCDSTKAE